MKAFDLYATLGLDSSAFRFGLSGAKGQFNAFASSLGSGLGKIDLSISGVVRSTASAMSSMEQSVQKGVTAMGAAFTAVMGGLATTGLKYNTMMENYQMDFATLLQDADKAAAKVEELRKMDLSSPLDMAALANATKLMLSFGVSEEEAGDKLEELGDISMGNAEKLNSMALAYSQIRSIGKLTMIDLRQMANQGFNPLKVVAEETGVAIGDLQDFMSYGKPSEAMTASIKAAQEEVARLGESASDGAKMLAQMAKEGFISADIVSRAITLATSEGGQFYKASENAAKTLTGQFSILQGGIKKLVGSGFEPLSDELAENILPGLNAFVDELDTAFNRRGGGAEGVSGMLAVVRDELNELRDDTGAFTEEARKGIIRASVLFNTTTKTINGTLPTMVDSGEALFAQLRIGFQNAIPNIADTAKMLAPPVSAGIISAHADFLGAGLDIVSSIAEGVSEDSKEGGDRKIASAIVNGLVGTLQKGGEALPVMMTAAGDLSTGVLEELTVWVGENRDQFIPWADAFATQMWSALSTSMTETGTAFTDLVGVTLFGQSGWEKQKEEIAKQNAELAAQDLGEDLSALFPNAPEAARQGLEDKFRAINEKYGITSSILTDVSGRTRRESNLKNDGILDIFSIFDERRMEANLRTLMDEAIADADLQKYESLAHELNLLYEGFAQGLRDEELTEYIELGKQFETIESVYTSTDRVNEWIVTNMQEDVNALNGSLEETIALAGALSGLGGGSMFQGKGSNTLSIDGINDMLNYTPGHATGLYSVPYDNYLARLHEGEAVLTKQQARKWRRDEADGMTVVQMQEASQRPVVISIDGTELATVLFEQMSRRIENGNLQQIYGMGG